MIGAALPVLLLLLLGNSSLTCSCTAKERVGVTTSWNLSTLHVDIWFELREARDRVK